MSPLIRVILVALLAGRLTILIATNNLEHGLLLVTLTMVLTYNLWRFYRWSTIVAMLFSCLLTLTLTGIGQGISERDAETVSATALLTLSLARPLYYLYWEGILLPWEESLALIATIFAPLLVLLWWYLQDAQVQQPVASTPTAQQFKRIVDAIGGDKRKQTESELGARFGSPDSDIWKNGLGSSIPESGVWPLYAFFPDFIDDGNTLTQGLWGQPVDKLQIDDSKQAALQPLLACRNATRALFNGDPDDHRYTPFFQVDDFHDAANPYEALESKIYKWVDGTAMQQAIKSHYGCETRPKPPDTLLKWVKTCVDPVDGFAGDKELQRIQDFADACGAIQFVSK